MDTSSKVLIAGAGVAGLTLAIWLGRNGFRPVVIEKASEIRADGYLISLSHAAWQYASDLGMHDDLNQYNSGITSSSYYDHRGSCMLQLDYQDLFAGIDVIQVMRDDLEALLYSRAKELADFRFSCWIESLTQDPDSVTVTFNNGSSETFDIVIGADGLHSTTRAAAFTGQQINRRYLGLSSAAFTLDNVLNLSNEFQNHMERNRYMCVYTTRQNTLATAFIWQSDDRQAPPPEQRRQHLLSAFAGTSSITEQVMQHCPQDEIIYMDPLMQIEMQSWYSGRVALVGDAAHCLTLLSGQGASSAFWGASFLANALIEDDYASAFARYEQELMPVLHAAQLRTRNAAKWYVPVREGYYYLRDNLMRYLPNLFFQKYFKYKYSRA